jgi:hypothetical protein
MEPSKRCLNLATSVGIAVYQAIAPPAKTGRLGAYGVLIKEGHVLLVLKGKGPFEGLWDLPGGGIELDETAEVALQRELDEEVCLHYTKASFLTTVTYQLPWKGGTFQQLGVIFRVQEWKESENKRGWLPI